MSDKKNTKIKCPSSKKGYVLIGVMKTEDGYLPVEAEYSPDTGDLKVSQYPDNYEGDLLEVLGKVLERSRIVAGRFIMDDAELRERF